jgi:hypothetical protein
VRSGSRCALRLRYVDLVVSIEVAVEVCCCFTVLSSKKRLKFNTGKVCNCLIQFLLTMVLSIEGRVFLVEYVFVEGNRYTFCKCTATFRTHCVSVVYSTSGCRISAHVK